MIGAVHPMVAVVEVRLEDAGVEVREVWKVRMEMRQ